MSEITTLKLPISSVTEEEIYNNYDTPQKLKELRSALIQRISAICTNSQKMILNETVPCEIDTASKLTRKVETKEYPLSEFDLEEYLEHLQEDPAWVPKSLKDKEVKHFELKIRDKTYKKLVIGAQLLSARMQKWDESLEMSDEEKEKLNDEQKIKFEEAKKMKQHKSKVFVCMQEFIYEQLFPAISESLTAKVDAQIRKDFEEDYPNVKT